MYCVGIVISDCQANEHGGGWGVGSVRALGVVCSVEVSAVELTSFTT